MQFGRNNIITYTFADYIPYQTSKLVNIKVGI